MFEKSITLTQLNENVGEMSESTASYAEVLTDIFYGDESATDPLAFDGGHEFLVLRKGTPVGRVTITNGDKPDHAGDDDDHEGLNDSWAADLAAALWEAAMESVFDDEPLIGAIIGHENGSFTYTSTADGETLVVTVYETNYPRN